ncbi:hypothetical protein KSX_54440 [Ktedonospora formicarum]|uniref:Uncharacterized protein n=1 Tax=Ktedonospora formicarum TaxID=2778364 RepID=A0A8J3I4A8_9CHLR|nr:hypothetical protein KSX_54440 [Ktedonospora formicarum]
MTFSFSEKLNQLAKENATVTEKIGKRDQSCARATLSGCLTDENICSSIMKPTGRRKSRTA